MIIAIKDLHEGINEFEVTIPSENYELDEAEYYPNPLDLNIFIDRLENLFRFKISIFTRAVYACDRCLEKYESNFKEDIEQIYQLGHSDLDGDEIEIFPENSKEIDISEAINEAIRLNRPIQLLCKNECIGLCVKCGTNLNQRSCDCRDSDIDPRLEKLKSLLK
jgi:uncharacterized protein